MATSGEGTKTAAGKSPGGVCDGSQHSLEGIEPFATLLTSQPSLSSRHTVLMVRMV